MVKNDELEDLVECAKQGKADAFEQLYNSTYRFVYFHAKSMTDDADEAWDLVQDTYMAVYRNLNTLRDSQRIKPWMSGIVYNLGCKRLRQKKVYLLSEDEEYLLQEIEEEDRETLPEDAWDKKETEELIRQAVEQLPPLQRMAVIAYYYDEKKIEEIARDSECSEGTIKSRLNYARKYLKEHLSQKEKEMGVTLHGITGPILFYALHRMFQECQVSPDRASAVWKQVSADIGTTAAGMKAEMAAHVSKAAPAAGKGAGHMILNVRFALIAAGLVAAAAGAGAGAGIYHSRQQISYDVENREVKNREGENREEVNHDGTVQKDAARKDAISGWLESKDGLQYVLKGGEAAEGEIRLGRQVYTFDRNGLLRDIRYLDQEAFYDEDKKYYGGDGVFVSAADESDVQKLSDIGGVTRIAESEGILYFFSEGAVYKMNADGTGLETIQNELWYSITDMAVEDGNMIFNYSDGGCSNNGVGIPQGAFIRYGADGRLSQWDVPDHYPAFACRQIQVLDGWIYCLRSGVPSGTGGMAGDALYRMEIDGNRVQRLTDGNVTAYLVHGDTAYYMQDGNLQRLSITEAARDMEKLESLMEDSPNQVYATYVEQVLLPQYGKINRFRGENYYEPATEEEAALWSCGIRPSELEPMQGILTFYVEDLDHDGAKDLAVLSVYQNTDWGWERSMLKLRIYTVKNGTVEQICEGDLGIIGFFGDYTEFKVAVKSTDSGTIFALCSQVMYNTNGDGTSAAVCMKEYRGDALVTLMDVDFTGGEEYYQGWDMLREQGFYVSAGECETSGDYLIWISDRELDTRILLHGQSQMEPWGFEEKAWDERRRRVQEMEMKSNFRDYPIKWSIELNQ